ncbi:MAG: zinc ribbon domain-containing protein [Halobacteriota archaeon]
MHLPREPICQSCGMPLRNNEDFGTTTDGSKSEEYCYHCFTNGTFLDEGITLQEKIEKNVKFGIEMGMSEDMARRICEDILPTLKRWQRVRHF